MLSLKQAVESTTHRMFQVQLFPNPKLLITVSNMGDLAFLRISINTNSNDERTHQQSHVYGYFVIHTHDEHATESCYDMLSRHATVLSSILESCSTNQPEPDYLPDY